MRPLATPLFPSNGLSPQLRALAEFEYFPMLAEPKYGTIDLCGDETGSGPAPEAP